MSEQKKFQQKIKIKQLEQQIESVEVEMKKIAAHLASTSDLLDKEKDDVHTKEKETAFWNRKIQVMESQIKQEIADKGLILQKIDALEAKK